MNIFFSQKIYSKMGALKAFELFKKTLTDSSKSLIWPNNYSAVKKIGDKLEVVYKFLGVNFKTYYNCIFSKNSITYVPVKNHPLKGEVKILFKKSANGCVIDWVGNYSNANIFHYLFFKAYSFFFFRAIKNKITN